MSEQMDLDGWGQPSNVVGEGRGWPIDQIGALREADRPQSSPVDGDGVSRLDPEDCLRRLLGVEMTLIMARNNGRPPASHWDQRYVDVHQLLERNVRTSVARIPPAPRAALNEIPERGSAITAPSVSPAVVVGGQDSYPQAGYLHKITGHDFMECQTAANDRLEQTTRACWGDELRRGWN